MSAEFSTGIELSGLLAASVRWLLVAVLASSSVAKVVVRRTGRDDALRTAEIVRQRFGFLPGEKSLVAAIAGAEALTALLLILAPSVGFLATVALFVGLLPVARLVPDDQSCGCFGSTVLEFGYSRTARTFRNLILATLAGAGAVFSIFMMPTNLTFTGIPSAAALGFFLYAIGAAVTTTTKLKHHRFFGSIVAEGQRK